MPGQFDARGYAPDANPYGNTQPLPNVAHGTAGSVDPAAIRNRLLQAGAQRRPAAGNPFDGILNHTAAYNALPPPQGMRDRLTTTAASGLHLPVAPDVVHDRDTPDPSGGNGTPHPPPPDGGTTPVPPPPTGPGRRRPSDPPPPSGIDADVQRYASTPGFEHVNAQLITEYRNWALADPKGRDGVDFVDWFLHKHPQLAGPEAYKLLGRHGFDTYMWAAPGIQRYAENPTIDSPAWRQGNPTVPPPGGPNPNPSGPLPGGPIPIPMGTPDTRTPDPPTDVTRTPIPDPAPPLTPGSAPPPGAPTPADAAREQLKEAMRQQASQNLINMERKLRARAAMNNTQSTGAFDSTLSDMFGQAAVAENANLSQLDYDSYQKDADRAMQEALERIQSGDRRYAADLGLQGTQYSADKSLAAARAGAGATMSAANAAAAASRYGDDIRMKLGLAGYDVDREKNFMSFTGTQQQLMLDYIRLMMGSSADNLLNGSPWPTGTIVTGWH